MDAIAVCLFFSFFVHFFFSKSTFFRFTMNKFRLFLFLLLLLLSQMLSRKILLAINDSFFFLICEKNQYLKGTMSSQYGSSALNEKKLNY